MAQGLNAGVKRISGPATEKKLSLTDGTWAELEAVRKVSGSLSRGRYIEAALDELRRLNGGALPVFNPTLDTEEAATAHAA